MEKITELLNLLDGWLGSAQPFILLGTGLFFTIYLGFPQIKYFKHAWRCVRGKYDKPEHEGDTSHFQALTTALSGTVGTGNIGGVALAVYLGGPAALFWMWMTAFFGMTTKFVEVSLSHKYRVKDEDGFIVGGPMFFMERRLNMKWLAVFFAVATVISSFGSGNLPQSNNMAIGMESTFGIPPWVTGGVLAILLGLVIIGGIRRIVKVTEKIVPIMAVIYLVGALAVIVANLDQVGPSFVSVFRDAFTGSAAAGGFLGATFAYAFVQGVKRGLFSNEAGQGSAPIAHAAARADEPISEGMVSILEPFIDTIVICTVTGLVILSSGVWTEKFENSFQKFDMEIIAGSHSEEDAQQRQQLLQHLSDSADDDPIRKFDGAIQVRNGIAVNLDEFTVVHNRSVAEQVRYLRDGEPYNGEIQVIDGELADDAISVRGYSLVHSVELTTKAFNRGLLGDYGQYIVSIGLVLFAFSTAVAWSYYGDRAIVYLFGLKLVMPYRVVYVFGFFMASISDTSFIWLISFITVALMTLPNLFGILMLHREMKETVADYWGKFRIEHPEGA
ncbi:MAG: AGCS family amino acid carrier protein [Pseudomonadales bacterium]|nr:AGCS family amino acid carrier protein [Pseudomonadales bacterium]MDP7358240.1 AGCS family amino acid carrier protein [Pseudomonadales bacterium]MDP7597721.1 AGCS family amino acid carrier protein [Pseudomonadales bacterium]HJN49040.1 AGCS family amino acid carrier protein [Pseudomonadales bacterium]